MPGSNIIYRSRRTESVSLALEMLEGGDCYDTQFLPPDCQTFCDLGCNVGYFPCLLAAHTSKPIKGIMIDANPEVVAEARWHVKTNKWDDVHVYQGIVGATSNPGGQAEFFVNEANTLSRKALVSGNRFHDYTKITAPVLSVTTEWRKHFDQERCQLLKIDIEGAELVFFQQEAEFLKLVDVIIVECHQGLVSFEELKKCAVANGFKLVFFEDKPSKLEDIIVVFKR
jgi:FkbM family methyltransferase